MTKLLLVTALILALARCASDRPPGAPPVEKLPSPKPTPTPIPTPPRGGEVDRYGGAESPEDFMSLAHDSTRSSALRSHVEELDGVRSLNSPPRDNLS